MSQQVPLRDDAAESIRIVQGIKDVADGLLDDGADRGDLKLLLRTLEELRLSFRSLSRFKERRKVTVFGSARTQPDHPDYQQAVAFGRAIAEAGYMVITGGGPGIMEAAHVGSDPSMAIGINIRLPFENANPLVEDDKLLEMNYFFTRKLLFIKEAHAVVLMPGGFGTLDEGFESLTLIQTGKSRIVPIVLLDNPGGSYWKEWSEYLDRQLYQKGMISEEDFSLFRVTDSVDDAVEEVTAFYRVFHSERYVRGRLVLRLLHPLSDELFERIESEFSDILSRGRFKRTEAHHHELNEADVAHLPRLSFHFNRRHNGRLRQLINLINAEA
ncbi:putative lysine decarboxylase [Planctomycetes bacterium Pan216]|uniref:AMP nucleosidase n=1 Tax=Kolteria novifilia TaxID=2527975 RepID=A0A518AYA8_9BACT|nr:putative lysine decarboxylase [Planctomycetes bacterium Pan216]